MKIGFIGAGRMGCPMMSRLVAAGHDVYALGRSAEKCVVIEELGAHAVTEAADAGVCAEVVVVCVFSDQQVRQVCLDGDLLATMTPGSVLVVHTTANPHTVETIAARAASHEVEVVDAPVSGGPHDAAAGKLTLFVGGADDTMARLRPVLSCYGDPLLHVGATGAGQRVKLVNNALFAAHIGLLAESIRLGELLGVAEPTLLAALPHASAASRVLSLVAAAGSVASFVATSGEFIRKDVAVVRTIAADFDGDLGVLDDVIDAGVKNSRSVQ